MYESTYPQPGDATRFEFRGTARQWFGIWIVNLMLTILTLGIYSAWAKVRTKKYFYQHTFVADRNFDYHATGLQILIGRIIVVAAFAVYALLSNIMPLVALGILVVFFFFFPVLIVRSMRFNAQMSSWSNVRFGFHGRPMEAMKIYILYPILVALTAYTTWPILDRAMKRFTMGNHSLGRSAFDLNVSLRPFYGAALAAIAWVLAVGIITVMLFASQITSLDLAALENDPAAATGMIVALYVFAFVGFFPAYTIYQAFIRNTVFNGLSLDGRHQFASDINPIALVWIAITNAFLVVISLGLLLPYTHVRMTRYLSDHTVLIPGGSLDHFLAGAQMQTGAIGDAYTDLEAIDVGLPI